MRRLGLALGIGLGAACGVSEQGIPAGKLAVVGDVALGPEDLLGVQTQLGPYAQLRFGGDEGRLVLLESLVAAELMAQHAVQEGLGDDPRVQLALWEEEAAIFLSAELERRVPRDAIAAQTDRLRAWYDEHPDQFWIDERRNMEGVAFQEHEAAEQALAQLRAGEAVLSDFGEQYATGLQARDDLGHPGFHSILFEEGLAPGDWLSAPVVLGRSLLVGRVQQIIDAERRSFDDPQVQEQLVQAVRAPLLAEAREQLLAELAERHPEQAP